MQRKIRCGSRSTAKKIVKLLKKGVLITRSNEKETGRSSSMKYNDNKKKNRIIVQKSKNHRDRNVPEGETKKENWTSKEGRKGGVEGRLPTVETDFSMFSNHSPIRRRGDDGGDGGEGDEDVVASPGGTLMSP